MPAGDELCSLRWDPRRRQVDIIDQTLLPHALEWRQLDSLASYCHAIHAMQVRGAPLIGITAAFGLARALAHDPADAAFHAAREALLATRPTAVNLGWALEAVSSAVRDLPPAERAEAALAKALQLRADDIASCARMGEHGLELLRALSPSGPLNIMTHCNAGWLATIEWGTTGASASKRCWEALAPVVPISNSKV